MWGEGAVPETESRRIFELRWPGGVPDNMRAFLALLVPAFAMLFACAAEPASALEQDSTCTNVPAAFAQYVRATLSDSTDLFQGAYPPATPLTCELLVMLQEELKDDSARYCFERLSRRYWMEDSGARVTHAYIKRHMSFPLAMAATAHWNEDHRIWGLQELQSYRHSRPQVCATKERYVQLEEQDSAAVRYLIRVLETTPLFIPGSENSTIHGIYIMEVMRTLDLFTGQTHEPHGDMRRALDMSEPRFQQALADWRSWLTP